MFEHVDKVAWLVSTGPPQHRAQSPQGIQRRLGMTDRHLDEPVPDVVEQSQEVEPRADDTDEADDVDLLKVVPLEADPADAAEQAREVELGEDDYR
jgi:hypothetical protein